ncbi:hypothetical protein [Kitasatospora aureofaciens]|uniref:hypothetical protein n=1 Tax=Kitasatospora aureofaciens TaxID=1894 RepID=UPI0033FC2EFC
MRLSKTASEVLNKRPEAPQNPADALAHIIEVYAEVPDDRIMIEATTNVYGPGVRTGLTMGDLRSLARLSDWNRE